MIIVSSMHRLWHHKSTLCTIRAYGAGVAARILASRHASSSTSSGTSSSTSSSASSNSKPFAEKLDKPLAWYPEYSPFKTPANPVRNTTQTTMYINHFLQSLVVHDFHRSRTLLHRIASGINVQYYKKTKPSAVVANIDAYYSCFLLLLTSQKILVHNLRLLIDDFVAQHRRLKDVRSSDLLATVSLIQTKFVLRLVECYAEHTDPKKSNEAIMKSSIAKYTKRVMKMFELNVGDIWRAAGHHQTQFAEICRATKTKLDLTSLKEQIGAPRGGSAPRTPSTSIDPYTDGRGFVDLQRLCQYISSSSFRSGKLYEYYDQLSSTEQVQFMNEYIQFNQERQLHVEAHCLDLVHDFSSPSKYTSASVNRFRSDNAALLYSWIESSAKYLNGLCRRLESSDPGHLDPHEKVLQTYTVHWNLLPKKTLLTIVLSNLLTMTISSPQDHVRLVDLVKKIAASFTRVLYKEPSYRHIRDHVLNTFDDTDGLKLFTALTSVVMEKCQFKVSERDLQVACEASALHHNTTTTQWASTKAFEHAVVSYEGSKQLGVVRIHPYLYHQYKAYDSISYNQSVYLPMLCPPKPWKSPTNGGYLNDLKPIVTTADPKTTLDYLSKAHATGQLDSLYAGLNSISSTAWAVNSRVLEVFNQAMAMDSGFLKLPPKLSHLDQTSPEFHDLKGLRIQYEMILKVCNAFDANGDMFYLPHNVDFRGRAYPMVSLLSHYQQDVVRSLMMFWHSKPLGETGFDWLKYHLVGLYGKDKLNMEQRLEYFDHMVPDVLGAASNPMESQWWMRADKPWQALALSMEIDAILRWQSSGNDIRKYRCRIPVHQDGSCNGLQHYAALGADYHGGVSVNLVPSQHRQDVYSKVLDIVQKKVDKDYKQNSELAHISKSILSRKLIKQTIMTTVYGVTKYGGAAQIEDRIKELCESYQLNNPHGLSAELVTKMGSQHRRLASYLSGLVLSSVSELFCGAHKIQDWLVENCRRVITSFDVETMKYVSKIHHPDSPTTVMNFFRPSLYKPMMWTSLSGFPVVQLYKNTKGAVVPTSLQSIKINKPSEIAPINTRKQINAIAPNFIHSLDSLHMFMTAVAAKLNSIGFVSVHDSFWTYPSDVDTLSRVLREEFVRLHTSSIIESLRADIMYTTETSYQLVWIKNSDYPELVGQIQAARASYDTGGKPSVAAINTILSHELVLSTESACRVTDLVASSDPELYISTKGKGLETYTRRVDDPKKTESLYLTAFTPVLYKVRVMECPPRGELDVSQVLKSRYFFT